MMERRVDLDLGTPCVLWTGFVDKDGYGRKWTHKRPRTHMAHRLVYSSEVGEIPKGYDVDHKKVWTSGEKELVRSDG